MNDRLTALLCVWEEADLLPGLLDSLTGVVDRVVLADGRYETYPGDHDASDDDTLRLFDEWAALSETPTKVIPAVAGGWPTEHAKRTALVDETAGHDLGDMLLVIDGDERLRVGNRRELRDAYGDFQLIVRGVPPTEGVQDACRLFAYRPGMEYRWHFGLFTRAERQVLLSFDRLGEDVVGIDHVHHLRAEARHEADQEYEAWLVPAERAIGAYGGR